MHLRMCECSTGCAANSLRLQVRSLQVSNLMWAFGKLLHDPGDEFLLVVEGAAVRMLPDFSPQELSNTLWGFAILVRSPSVFGYGVCV